MQFVGSICLAFVLDLLIGDPAWIPHPVVIMGKCITAFENVLRAVFPKTPKGERLAGRFLAALLPVGTFLLTAGILYGCYRIHPAAAFVLNTFWCSQALAVKDMLKESRNVAREVALAETIKKSGEIVALPEETGSTNSKNYTKGYDSKSARKRAKKNAQKNAKRTARRNEAKANAIWDDARKAVGRIVGRDTTVLDQAGIIRAAVETVAENFSDGVFAPMFYMMIGGAPLALTYKSINTMDSMVGYKNRKYVNFGRAAARLDDAANFLPSRLAALVLILAVRICEGKQAAGNAFRIWRRDRLKHPSPNSAQTESVMAGGLGVRLLGPTWYFGKRYDKEWIGDDTREIETKDIARANHIFQLGSAVSLVILAGVRIVSVLAATQVMRLF